MKRQGLIASAFVVYAAASSPAFAAEKIMFDVPSGPLNSALLTFATQARISIDTSDPAFRSVGVGGLRGRFAIREGLRQLLRGTGYSFRISRENVVTIFRQSARLSPRTAPARSSVKADSSLPQPANPPPPPETIIVTASKQDVALADYPGAIHVASFDQSQSLRFGSTGSEALLKELPNLVSTDLGSGRNKIFVGGIADSSFNGQLQSTVSQYFGDSRLTYSAPDPDLALYDIDKVEVVEGPQGTLYGAGSLGGVIHIVPRPAELAELQVNTAGAINLTGGEFGGDGVVVANIPMSSRSAVCIVGYRVWHAGYIDDVRRDLSDINNDYRLAFTTFRVNLGFAKLLSNTSYTHHSIDTVFDATSPALQVPSVFEEDMRVSLLTHETRITGTTDWISNWVSGFSIARNINHIERFLGPVSVPASISKVRSETVDDALFGEATIPLWHTVSITGGGRLSYVWQVDEYNTKLDESSFKPTRSQLRFLPTAALSWKPWKGAIGYLRYQEGFRPGAQQLTESGNLTTVTRLASDGTNTMDIGMRFGTDTGSRLSGGLSYRYSRWNRVQADLVTIAGFPYVANLGSGFVRYTSADLSWQSTQGLRLALSGFLATSHLDRPTAEFDAAGERELPNIADSGWHFTGRFEPWIGDRKITLDGSVGYVGTSYLGVSDSFKLPQGNYLETAIGSGIEFGIWGISLDVENVMNSRANRFSYGNPFSVTDGNQRTPLRPRNVRVGIDARF